MSDSQLPTTVIANAAAGDRPSASPKRGTLGRAHAYWVALTDWIIQNRVVLAALGCMIAGILFVVLAAGMPPYATTAATFSIALISLSIIATKQSSRLLKKSLRFRKNVGRRQFFRLGGVHGEKWASALGHFRLLFTLLDTLHPWKRGAWAGEQDCRRRRQRRTQRGPCRDRAPSVGRARPLSCPSRNIPRCVCAVAG